MLILVLLCLDKVSFLFPESATFVVRPIVFVAISKSITPVYVSFLCALICFIVLVCLFVLLFDSCVLLLAYM